MLHALSSLANALHGCVLASRIAGKVAFNVAASRPYVPLTMDDDAEQKCCWLKSSPLNRSQRKDTARMQLTCPGQGSLMCW
jgi:hypothetical protein